MSKYGVVAIISPGVIPEHNHILAAESYCNKNSRVIFHKNVLILSREYINIRRAVEKLGKQDVYDKKDIIAQEKELVKDDKITIKCGYVVSYPKGKALQGL